MHDEAFAPYLTWLGFSALIGSLTIRLVDLWRLRMERHFYATHDSNAGPAPHTWLARHPVWDGIVVGLLALAIGYFLISSYRSAQRYWATLPAPEPVL